MPTMDRKTFESQRIFAGEKKPSMLRRCVDHDYTGRMMYMVTMVTEGRRPLFGSVVGRSDAPAGSPDAPHIELSKLGERVSEEWWGIPRYYPQIEIISLQMMPDHLHGILFVKEQMERDLSRVIRGFKTGCHRAYRELFPTGACGPSGSYVSYVATQSQQTEPQQTEPQQTEPPQPPPQQAQQPPQQQPQQPPQKAQPPQQAQQPPQQQPPQPQAFSRPKEDRTHGFLFARGYNDRLLLRQGQLQRWLDYLHDNPRRLIMKREHPDLFRVQRGLTVGGLQFSAIGNRFLLDRPLLVQVQCSRRLTEEQINAKVAECLALARSGAVLVSPSISPGEKRVMRAAFEGGFPLIILQENGFTDLAKPSGKRMEACQRGQILLLAPWDHHNERLTIRRDQCLSLNDMARTLCER